MTATMTPALLPREDNCSGNCEGRNDVRTDALRRQLLAHVSYGGELVISRLSGVCLSSVRKQCEGEARLSAPVLRILLQMAPPDVAVGLLSLWSGIPMSHP